MSAPFAYPAVPHARNHGPQGYTDYTSYRPWLRDEFSFRCVYCLFREQWGRVRGVYTLDHFLPVALHPGKATDYDNLLYVLRKLQFGQRSSRGSRPSHLFH